MQKLNHIKAVIFDWAGKIIDYGCMAPTQVFVQVFKSKGVFLSIEEARGPMGLAKKDHIRELMQVDSIQKQWMIRFRRYPTEADVEEVYTEIEPVLSNLVKNYTTPIPGAIELINLLKSQGIKIGTTTGYVAEMMDNIVPITTALGLVPDSVVNSSEVPTGRPCPWMIYRNCEKMGVFPLNKMVKIGDTVADIQEGINAGMWTIGVTKSGNELGLSLAETEIADPIWLKGKIAIAEQKLLDAGADYVVDGVWDCLPILYEIDNLI
jgi:phosphonoacetaldehyde hydrolase